MSWLNGSKSCPAACWLPYISRFKHAIPRNKPFLAPLLQFHAILIYFAIRIHVARYPSVGVPSWQNSPHNVGETSTTAADALLDSDDITNVSLLTVENSSCEFACGAQLPLSGDPFDNCDH